MGVIATTVESVFNLIDRASPKLRAIERQALKTEAALKKAGGSLDKIGARSHADRIDRLSGSLNRSSRSSDMFSNRLVKLGAHLLALGKIIGVAKLPAMGIAIGVAVQAVSALSAGVVALIPRIADLGGAAAPAIAGITGIGLAMVTVKLATNDLKKAWTGNKKALAALTPEGRQFLKTLQSFKPAIKDLRQSAQRGLFPGLDKSLQQLRAALPLANKLVNQMGRALGGVARRGTARLTTKGALSDLNVLGTQGTAAVTALGDALFHVVRGFEHVGVAAKPFTDWVISLVRDFGVWFERTARLNRENGKLAKFFDRTKSSLKLFGGILRNVWVVFVNIGKAARPLGDDLWHSVDRVTKRWADWTGSLQGQNWLRKWFEDARRPLHAMFRLIGDLGKAIVSIKMSGLTDTINALDKGVAPLGRAAAVFAQSGPALAAFITQLFRLLANLGGALTPFSLILGAMTNMLSLLNDLIESWKGFAKIIEAIVIGATLLKLRSWFYELAGAIRIQGGAARVAAAETRMATTAVNTSGASRLTSWISNITGGFRRQASAARTARTESEAAMYGASGGMIPGGAARAGRGGFRGGLAAAGRGVGGFLGPLIGLGALFGAAQGTSGNGIKGLGQNIISGATLGLTGPGASKGVTALGGAAAGAGIGTLIAPGLGTAVGAGIGAGVGFLSGGKPTLHGNQAANAYLGKLQQGGSEANYAARIGAIQRQITRLNTAEHTRTVFNARGMAVTQTYTGVTEKQRKEVERLNQALAQQKNALGNLKAQRIVADLQSALSTALSKRGRGSDFWVKEVVQSFKGLPGRARESVAQSSLNMLREQAKQNPRLWRVYRNLRDRVVGYWRDLGINIAVINGQILTGSKSQWNTIETTISSAAFRALKHTTSAYQQMRDQALGWLKQAGYTPAQAKSIFGAATSGSAGIRQSAQNALDMGPGKLGNLGRQGQKNQKARGGRLGGSGLQDTVPVTTAMAAPGELIVNRHTEARVNRVLSQVGTSLGHEVDGETRPHSFNLGGRRPRGASGIGHPELKPGIAALVSNVLSAFPSLAITSTTGGHHAPNSYHYRGMAADIGGDTGTMFNAAGMVRRRYHAGLTEGIHNPNLAVKDGRVYAGAGPFGSVWAGHANHIHLAVAGGAGAFGAGPGGGAGGAIPLMPTLRARQMRGGGVPGAIANALMGGVGMGLTGSINRRLGAMGPGMGGGAPGKGILGFGQIVRLAQSVGMPNPVLMAHIAEAESSGNPSVVNSIGATGLWQIYNHPDLARAYGDLRNPRANALAAKSLLSTQGLGAWDASRGSWGRYAAKGMRVPWYGNGGSFTVHRPTLIGVGDGGTEHVSVTPKGKGAGGRPVVKVHIEKIENHRSGDIQRHLEDEIGRAFDHFARTMEQQGTEDVRAVMD